MTKPISRALLAGIAALFLATGTAHASVHRSFHRCDKYLVTNAWSFDQGDKWSLLFQRNGSWKMRALPNRLFRQTRVDLYYRELKCSQIFYSELPNGVVDAIWKPSKVPPWTENKEPPWTDHIQPPKGDGWEDIEK
jgi:hypothetical protein